MAWGVLNPKIACISDIFIPFCLIMDFILLPVSFISTIGIVSAFPGYDSLYMTVKSALILLLVSVPLMGVESRDSFGILSHPLRGFVPSDPGT